MIDRSTKILLLAIAAGLWANAAVFMIRPANADSFLWAEIKRHLEGIDAYTQSMDTNIYRIRKGDCENKKICPTPASP